MPSAALDSDDRSRVLLIEDVDAMRLYLRLTLEGHGFVVTEAANLFEARNYLRAGNHPGSVLLDLELPDGHGLDIIRELPADVRVVALSADESTETELQCRRAGCAAVFSKSGRLGDLGHVMAAMERHCPPVLASPRPGPELAGQYSSYLAEVRVELQRARNRRDFNKVRRIAHQLRGTAVHFGYNGISASARNIGQAIAAGDINHIESTLEGLIEQLLAAAESHRTQ